MSLAALALALAPVQEAGAIDVSVDPRIELVSIVFRLAGNPEYRQKSATSAYSAEVDRHFASHAEHGAIQMARALRAERGISYDAVPSLALHLEDVSSGKERVPFDLPPAHLDRRWDAASARAFAAALREFAEASGFQAFFDAHAELYGETERRMSAFLDASLRPAWFASYFGVESRAAFRLHPALLLGGTNYGSSVVLADGREELSPCIGCWKWDERGIPTFEGAMLPTIVHEFCHAFANPVVDAHLAELEPAARRIFPFVELAMRDQAYGAPSIVLRESLTRAAVVRYLAAHSGKKDAYKQGADDARRGFLWVPDLAALLGEYEAARGEHPALSSFAPRIAAFFEATAAEIEEEHAGAPRVVRMVPENGATGVSPGLTELAIEFDRPMADGGWSLMGGGPSFPELDATRPIAYDAAGVLLTVPVRLAPGREYRFDLNHPSQRGFRSRAGAPLVPVRVRFRTGQG